MNDTALALLAAGALSAAAVAAFVWRVRRADPATPDRLIGELRLAQIAAVLLVAVGATSVGLSVAAGDVPAVHLDATFGVAFVVLGAFVLQREPRDGLLSAAIGFLAHALVAMAHRPGLLAVDLAPRWFLVGSDTYDVCLAALCYWTWRR